MREDREELIIGRRLDVVVTVAEAFLEELEPVKEEKLELGIVEEEEEDNVVILVPVFEFKLLCMFSFEGLSEASLSTLRAISVYLLQAWGICITWCF